MSDLTLREQAHVRTALRFLRLRCEGWAAVAAALRVQYDTIHKIAVGSRSVTASMAIRVARFVGVSIDDLLVGRFLPTRTCPHCGHPPDDFFADEETTP